MFATFLFTADFAAQDYSEPDFTHSEGMPWCFEDVGPERDCALQLEDNRIVLFDYLNGAEQDEFGSPVNIVEVSVNTPEGEVLQTFREQVGRPMERPSAVDVDRDGDLEVFLPTYTGNVNTSYRVWQQVGGNLEFAGEVNGLGLAYDEDKGLLAISARGSAATYYYEAYVLREIGLVSVYSLETNFMDMRCRFVEGPGFAETGHNAQSIVEACEAEMEDELQ